MTEIMTHERAIETSWTGTFRGPVFYDNDGKAHRQVFDYTNGVCDAYVTRAQAEDRCPDPNCQRPAGSPCKPICYFYEG